MPVYHARGISARLGTFPLAETITPNIVLRKGELAKQQCEMAEKKLLGSMLLTEAPVIFPGDDAGFELNWLGHAPFMQCAVGNTFSQVHGHRGQRSRQHSNLRGDNMDEVDNHREPRALILHVDLSDKTFRSGLSGNKSHLKIDVLFNGQLASCLFIPFHDVRSGAKSLHQVFAGTRVDYLAERPWVILPSGIGADGSTTDVGLISSVKQRWQHLRQALQQEANERGRNKSGSISPSAEYLRALASMPMPEQVNNMQKPGCKHFGVIDVVISAGDGRKITSGTSYLKAPQRLADENFPLTAGINDISRQLRTQDAASEVDESVKERVRASADLAMYVGQGESDPEYEPHAKRRAIVSRLPSPDPVPVFSTSFQGVPIPLMPPPTPASLGPLLSSTLGQSHVETHSSLRFVGGHTRLNSSPKRGRIHSTTGYPQKEVESDHGSALMELTHELHQHFGPYGYTCHSQEIMSPHMFSDPLYRHSSPDGLGGAPFFGSVSLSSPSQRYPMDTDSLYRYSTLILESDRLAPAARSGYIPAPAASASSLNMHHRSPHTPNPFEYHGVSSMSSVLFPPSMPLPPTAMFTVPTKPKRGISVAKADKPPSSALSGQNILVTRLLITGREGATVVDHNWHKACYIPRRRSTNDLFSSESAAKCSTNLPSHDSPCELGVREPTLIDDCDARMEQRDSQSFPLKIVSSQLGDPTPQRRSKPRSQILGVQGPMAATFIYEDPEVLMRKSIRSRSPSKRNGEPESPSRSHSNMLAAQTSVWPETVASSPLSSAPNTPDLDSAPHVIQNQAIGLLPTVLETSSEQRSGSSEFHTGHVQTPSPSKSTAGTMPYLYAPTPVTTKSSPNAKKRKAATRNLPKLPRSPDQLQTTSNPPLNRDCVIAYAESEAKYSEQGVLRQVRGERQGIFQEEYVVFAARFFVPGS